MKKEKLLKIIIDYYLESSDFNGIANYELDKCYEYDIKALTELINDDDIIAISGDDIQNPHINAYKLVLTKEHQISTIEGNMGHICFYPTEKALKNIPIDHSKPYTALLRKGKPQFQVVFFDIEILERYINNPKCQVMDSGYIGTICIKDEFWDEDSENDDYIKDYGMAYIEGDTLRRAVGVFLRDLSNLTGNKQLLWKGFELPKQENCRIEEGFIKNLVFGEWVTKHWIFTAILEEMKIINDMCEAIDIPHFFNKTYGTHFTERPGGYNTILLPTSKNYYDFVSVLEKLVVHNINYKTFMKAASCICPIDRKKEDGTVKGSLVMLQEWLGRNVKASFDVQDIILKPLKKVRKLRQKPAHELYSNQYDITIYEKQKSLMSDVYLALKGIRCLFMGHPLAQSVNVPNYLIEGENIVFY